MEETKTIEGILADLPLRRRRNWIIKILMDDKRICAADIARRHRFTRWYIASAINGLSNLTPKLVLAIEKEVGVKIRSLLEPKELLKLRVFTNEVDEYEEKAPM